MPKTCKAMGCNYTVFSHDFCKGHQSYRTDKDYKKPTRKKKGATGEFSMFQEIALEREPISFLSNKHVGALTVNCMSHVLAKGKYPKFRLNKNNIIILTPREHRMFDFGTIAEREKYAKEVGCDWNIIHKLEEELKEEYKLKYESY